MENNNLAIELTMTGISSVVSILIVALPLLPAILIYTIFPKTNIRAYGTIGALTWNASGAFAAYVIVLVIIMVSPLERLLTSSVGVFHSPAWTVEFKIDGYDSQNKPKQLNITEVVLDPALHRISSERVMLRIPGLKRLDWPVVQIHAPNASKQLNLATLKNHELEIDHYKKHITVLKPIVIKEVQTAGNAYPAPGSTSYFN